MISDIKLTKNGVSDIVKNRITLLLEASLLNKVYIKDIILLNKERENFLINENISNVDLNFNSNVNNNTYNKNKNNLLYDVWLYSPDILKELVPYIIKNNGFSTGRNQIQLDYKFKLGSIIFEDLKSANDDLKKHLQNNNNLNSIFNSNSNDSYFIILSEANIGSAMTYVYNGDPRDKFQSTYLQNQNNDLFYINGEQSAKNEDIQTYHWFYVRNNSSKYLTHIALIEFKVDNLEKKCYNSSCGNHNTPLPISQMKYCHNDQKYFCSSCVDEYHSKQVFSTLKKHHITSALSFSINYSSNCKVHKLKQLEFYCFDCNGLFCIKCFDVGGDHYNINNDIISKNDKKFDNDNISLNDTDTKKKHNIKLISDVYNTYEEEINLFTTRLVEIENFIEEEIENRNANTKNLQKNYKNQINDINNRLKEAQEELENEVLVRSTYLASITVELQRIICEFDSKIHFLKQMYFNSDQSTYICMVNMFNKYMKEELIPNLDLLSDLGYEQITTNLFTIEKKENDIVN